MYKLATKSGKNALGSETFKSKTAAKQAKIDMIKGAPAKRAIRYLDYSIRKTKQTKRKR